MIRFVMRMLNVTWDEAVTIVWTGPVVFAFVCFFSWYWS